METSPILLEVEGVSLQSKSLADKSCLSSKPFIVSPNPTNISQIKIKSKNKLPKRKENRLQTTRP